MKFKRKRCFWFWFGLFNFNFKSFASIIWKCFLLGSLLWNILKMTIHWKESLIKSSHSEVFQNAAALKKETKPSKKSCEDYFLTKFQTCNSTKSELIHRELSRIFLKNIWHQLAYFSNWTKIERNFCWTSDFGIQKKQKP